MQTFAPDGRDLVSGFSKLDRERLGKQRVETYQILRTLLGISSGWRNHPATVMWENHIPQLAYYGMVCCQVWIDRGYNDNLQSKFSLVVQSASEWGYDCSPPMFLDLVAESHRSNLVRKMPKHYRTYWPDVPDDIPYLWPQEYDGWNE